MKYPYCFIIWNNSDPVADFEKRRNQLIKSIQGNANQFIQGWFLPERRPITRYYQRTNYRTFSGR